MRLERRGEYSIIVLWLDDLTKITIMKMRARWNDESGYQGNPKIFCPMTLDLLLQSLTCDF